MVFNQNFKEVYTGISQKGIISQVLGNFVLDGLEGVIQLSKNYFIKPFKMEISFRYKDFKEIPLLNSSFLKLKIVRYAEVFIIFGRSREVIKQIKARVYKFLQVRGLNFLEERTKILNLQKVPLYFLGYTLRYREF